MNQKQQIGKVAASLLEEQDVIFIDSGTTACQIIPFMNVDMHLTVITHSAFDFVMLESKKNEYYMYWLDSAGVHHVPKRDPEALIYTD